MLLVDHNRPFLMIDIDIDALQTLGITYSAMSLSSQTISFVSIELFGPRTITENHSTRSSLYVLLFGCIFGRRILVQMISAVGSSLDVSECSNLVMLSRQ